MSCKPYPNFTLLCIVLQDLCQVLEAGDVSEAVQLCVCADQLSDPDTFWDVTQHRQQQLNDWWQRRMAARDLQLCGPLFTDTLYLDAVARLDRIVYFLMYLSINRSAKRKHPTLLLMCTVFPVTNLYREMGGAA